MNNKKTCHEQNKEKLKEVAWNHYHYAHGKRILWK